MSDLTGTIGKLADARAVSQFECRLLSKRSGGATFPLLC